MLIDHPRILTQYRALRLPPGTPVRYNGSVKRLRGEYTAEPCACLYCIRDLEKGIPAERYDLYDDGAPGGVYHVRHTSVTPLGGTRDDVNDWLPESATETHVTRLIEKEYPTIEFVRASIEDEILYITWAGGPRETEIRTITAHCLANYTNGEFSAVPRPVTVDHVTGTPKVSGIDTLKLPRL